ncbi:hypothetical protein EI94DRAFT_1345748 [Lactarius quietus]|nr:hypothetical protein EI94DRAFT_1345748 [Lactarius quietus]
MHLPILPYCPNNTPRSLHTSRSARFSLQVFSSYCTDFFWSSGPILPVLSHLLVCVSVLLVSPVAYFPLQVLVLCALMLLYPLVPHISHSLSSTFHFSSHSSHVSSYPCSYLSIFPMPPISHFPQLPLTPT